MNFVQYVTMLFYLKGYAEQMLKSLVALSNVLRLNRKAGSPVHLFTWCVGYGIADLVVKRGAPACQRQAYGSTQRRCPRTCCIMAC